ncbi:MAG: undecaprenyl-diphosphate phosphatase [Holosporales bacterium]
MDFTAYFYAALMGIIEGLTEFLPVSSTGHLILAGHFLNFQSVPGNVFEVVIQFGAILAVCMVYFQRLWKVVVGLPHKREAQLFTRNILLGFLPAAVLGVLFHDIIKERLFNEVVVAWSLLLGGLFIIAVDKLRLQPKYYEVETMPAWFSLKVGFFQALAMIPGVSRSGATILGAWLFGADRKAAMEFSFFLAIPTMLGAATFDLYKNWDALKAAEDAAGLMLLGTVTAFITAAIVVRYALYFVHQYGFTPFGWYRIVVGSALLMIV